jgi:hypothetical protein
LQGLELLRGLERGFLDRLQQIQLRFVREEPLYCFRRLVEQAGAFQIIRAPARLPRVFGGGAVGFGRAAERRRDRPEPARAGAAGRAKLRASWASFAAALDVFRSGTSAGALRAELVERLVAAAKAPSSICCSKSRGRPFAPERAQAVERLVEQAARRRRNSGWSHAVAVRNSSVAGASTGAAGAAAAGAARSAATGSALGAVSGAAAGTAGSRSGSQ